MRKPPLIALAAAGLLLTGAAARAEEGMWTFDEIPSARVEQSLGVRLDQAWLDHLRDASARLTTGCSGAVVSAQGLVLTNQHCILDCEQSLSASNRDLIADGFMVDATSQERTCPGLQVETLQGIADVTGMIFASSAGKFGDDYVKAREEMIARVEHAYCKGDAKFRCQVISFYGGGLFKVYRYRRFADVRLVFAPEFDIAFFGGDEDNFSFPRHDLDCAFLRLYENGRPATTPAYLSWSSEPLMSGEAVFVAGSPGATERGVTVTQMQLDRDVVLPISIRQHEALRDRLLAFGRQSAEHRRIAADRLFDVNNDLKVLRGRAAILGDSGFLTARGNEELALKARLAVDAKFAAQIGDPWAEIAALRPSFTDDYVVWRQLENTAGGGSQLFSWARTLVRAAMERASPQAQRLPEYADSRLPLVHKVITDERTTYPELEQLYLAQWLTQTRDGLGASAPATVAFVGDEGPDAFARRLVGGTRLADPQVRRALWDGGLAAIERSNDPMIQYVLRTDPLSRAARRLWEDDVQGPIQEAGERIARVRFAVAGAGLYPDATYSPRLTFGKVAGWEAGAASVAPFTQLGGLFERATGAEPYRIPDRWLAAHAALDSRMVMNFVTTNDITGGNSGSPVVNARGEIVGTAFDGNKASIAGEFTYDGSTNRTVAVSTAVIGEALTKVYGRTALVGELERR